MQKTISLEKLKGVPRTLLIPLRGRYLETKRPDGIIDDPKSVEIIDSIDHDFGKSELPWVGQMLISARTHILDKVTRKFLKANPDGVIVNLGSGLDTRRHRVDNGRMLWYDLDLEEGINLRKKFFKQTERFKFIAKSVMDFSWVEDIAKGRKTLFIAEGLLNYLSLDQVKKIVMAIKKHFPSSEFVFEAFSRLIRLSRYSNSHIKNALSMFNWTLHSGKSLEKWGSGIKFLKEWYYWDCHPKRWKWMRYLRRIRPLSRTMKIVHLRFA